MFGMMGGMMGGGGAAGGPTTAGGKLYSDRSCNSCHGNNGEGSQGPNITPSTAAGIGAWTTDQIKSAIRDGKNKDGKNLCSSMPRWSTSQISDSDLATLVDFLQKELTAVDVPNQGSLCGESGGAGGSTGGGMMGGFNLNISTECFSCLDARCPDLAGPLHCFAGGT
jgi:cytochrome c553